MGSLCFTLSLSLSHSLCNSNANFETTAGTEWSCACNINNAGSNKLYE